MTYCCDHIRKAHELISSAKSEINWNWKDNRGDALTTVVAGIFTLNSSTIIQATNLLDRGQRKLDRGYSLLGEAQSEINACSCSNYSELRSRFNRVNGDYQEYKDKYETTRDERTREQISSTQTTTRLEQQLIAANNNNSDLTRRLTDSDNKVLRLENSSSEDRVRIQDLDRQLNNLQLGNTTKEKENDDLKKNLKIKQREVLNETLNFKEYKLEIFVNRLDIGLRKVQNLRRKYKELIAIREGNGGVNNTEESNVLESITLIQENLQEEDVVSIINVQKLCRKCEKLAKIELEIENLRQQQYEARQEVPTN